MKSIAIRVDERIELLSVLAHLSTYDQRLRTFCKVDPLPRTHPLYRRFVRHFAAAADSEAVRTFERVTQNPRFMCDAPVRFFLSFDGDDGDRASNGDRATDRFDEELVERCGDVAPLTELRAASLAFREETRFREYFQANADYYAELESTVALWLRDARPVEVLEAYLGVSKPSYRLVLAPLLVGNYGAYSDADAGCEVCAVVTPVDSAGRSFGNDAHVLSIAWHEYLHSTINALTDRFIGADSGRASELIVDEKMVDRGYPEAQTVINESIIRAIVVRLFHNEYGAERAEKIHAREVGMGFAYVPKIVELLRSYEADRGLNRTIADYYPRLLSAFSAAEA